MPLIEHPPEEHPAYKQDQNVCKSHVAVPKSENTNNFSYAHPQMWGKILGLSPPPSP